MRLTSAVALLLISITGAESIAQSPRTQIVILRTGIPIPDPDRTVVLSGDDRPNDAIAGQCNECDVLIHEVYSDSGFAKLLAARQALLM